MLNLDLDWRFLFVSDCGDPGVPNGISVASTKFGENHFIQCNTGYTGGGGKPDGIECLADGTWDITLSCDARGEFYYVYSHLAGMYYGVKSISLYKY